MYKRQSTSIFFAFAAMLLLAPSASGPAKVLAAGAVGTFRLPLPKAVLRRLAALGPKQALRARIAVRATDLANRNTQRKLVVPLRGRDHHA